jgi:hypothetical protein
MREGGRGQRCGASSRPAPDPDRPPTFFHAGFSGLGASLPAASCGRSGDTHTKAASDGLGAFRSAADARQRPQPPRQRMRQPCRTCAAAPHAPCRKRPVPGSAPRPHRRCRPPHWACRPPPRTARRQRRSGHRRRRPLLRPRQPLPWVYRSPASVPAPCPCRAFRLTACRQQVPWPPPRPCPWARCPCRPAAHWSWTHRQMPVLPPQMTRGRWVVASLCWSRRRASRRWPSPSVAVVAASQTHHQQTPLAEQPAAVLTWAPELQHSPTEIGMFIP